jgi:AraC-like DNA-binding protein
MAGLQSVDVSLLEQLFDSMPDVAFFVKDQKGRYQTVNLSLVERHGLSDKSQVIGKQPCDISSGNFGQIPSQQDERVLTTGVAIHDHLELQWHTPNQPCWCLTTKLPIRDDRGHVVGLIGVSRDVRAPVNPKEIPDVLVTVLERFDRQISEPVSPSSLASSAGMSPTRFARLMKRLFGLTPSQYIAKHRVGVASELLRTTNNSIADIALACGYYDHSAFTRVFHKLTGVSPTAFRKASVRSH